MVFVLTKTILMGPYAQVVCTLGPKSRSVEVLAELLKAGMSVARFNFSHGSHDYHQVGCSPSLEEILDPKTLVYGLTNTVLSFVSLHSADSVLRARSV